MGKLQMDVINLKLQILNSKGPNIHQNIFCCNAIQTNLCNKLWLMGLGRTSGQLRESEENHRCLIPWSLGLKSACYLNPPPVYLCLHFLLLQTGFSHIWERMHYHLKKSITSEKREHLSPGIHTSMSKKDSNWLCSNNRRSLLQQG